MPVGVGDRSERIVMVAAAIGGVFCVAAAFWPGRDFEAEYKRLAETEAKAIAVWRAVVTEAQAGRLSDAAVSDRIERDVLPVWRDARRQADALAGEPGRVPPRLPEAFRVRQEAWEAMVAAERAGDGDLGRRADEKWAEANRIVAELRGNPTAQGAAPR